MATEEGIVTALGDGVATVRTTPSAACKSCSAHGSCHANGDEREVEVLNPIGAGCGDRIVLNLSSGAFLRATFLLYIVPIIGLMLGAGLGHYAAPFLGINPSLSAAMAAFACFGLAVGFVRFQGDRMARRSRYRPAIIRVIRRAAPADAVSQCQN
jgi:sigma-E factor negative regulatory protein RseC